MEPGDAQELPKRRPGTLQTSILDKFGDVFGHFWMDFGRILEGFKYDMPLVSLGGLRPPGPPLLGECLFDA